VGAQVERLTGRPVERGAGTRATTFAVHPMQAVAITIGLGFLLGKLLARD
jgi:ElaB/YqjD/DUF883 family membrane-anchored ribosome-binding protein